MAKQGKHRAPATSATWFGRRREGQHRAGGAEAVAEHVEPEMPTTGTLAVVPPLDDEPAEPLATTGPQLLAAPRAPVLRAVEDDVPPPPVVRAVEDPTPRRRGRRAHPDADTDAIPLSRGSQRAPSLYPFAVPQDVESSDADREPEQAAEAGQVVEATEPPAESAGERSVTIPFDLDEEPELDDEPELDKEPEAVASAEPDDEASAPEMDEAEGSAWTDLIVEPAAPEDEDPAAVVEETDHHASEDADARPAAAGDAPAPQADAGALDTVLLDVPAHDDAQPDASDAAAVELDDEPVPELDSTRTEQDDAPSSDEADDVGSRLEAPAVLAPAHADEVTDEDLHAARPVWAIDDEVAAVVGADPAPVWVLDLDESTDLPAHDELEPDEQHRAEQDRAAHDLDEQDPDEPDLIELEATEAIDWTALLRQAEVPAGDVQPDEEPSTVAWALDEPIAVGSPTDEQDEAVEGDDPATEDDEDPDDAWARLLAATRVVEVAAASVSGAQTDESLADADDEPDEVAAAEVRAEIADAHPIELALAPAPEPDADIAVDLPAGWGSASDDVTARELDEVRSETTAIALPDLSQGAPSVAAPERPAAPAAPAADAPAPTASAVPPVVASAATATRPAKAAKAGKAPAAPAPSGLVRKRPPLMSRNTVVGLDFGFGVLRAAEVALVAKGRPVLVRYQEVVLPRDAVKEGVVVDQRVVVDALRQLWGLGGFKTKNVIIGMGSQQVLIRELTVPKMPLPQLRETLPFRVQDTLPLPVEEALLDFVPTSEFEAPEGVQLRGLLIAATRESVLANARAVEAAGLRVMDVDLIPFAVSRATLGEGARTGTEVLLHVGAVSTSVVVVDDGVPQFVRTLQTGGDEVTAALVDGLGVDANRAERIKRAVGMSASRASDEQSERAAHIAADAVGELVRAVRATVSFYRNAHRDVAVEGLLLSGGGAQLRGFSGALSLALGLPVTATRTGAGFAVGPKVDEVSFVAAGPAPTVALGLTLRSSAA